MLFKNHVGVVIVNFSFSSNTGVFLEEKLLSINLRVRVCVCVTVQCFVVIHKL